jgi:hypothetical protein
LQSAGVSLVEQDNIAWFTISSELLLAQAGSNISYRTVAASPGAKNGMCQTSRFATGS